ncbi:type II toxin-antitoxin system VapB family antitoxin [Thiothrix fructosivorans]|jgi:Arc/MetJ family transcription regulator|nr:type II toxin-antitoxin system VapB family antitoxin [Thiothrix fructosivorans]
MMRTNIVIDETLIQSVMQETGLKTKREAVERGLQLLLRLSRQARIREFRGKLQWEGDLEASRQATV